MEDRKPIRICHIITSLDVGGAEMMLLKLVRGIDATRFSSEVISLTNGGPIGTRLQRDGFRVRCAAVGGLGAPAGVVRLIWWLRSSAPDIVQTWMYHGDVVGGVAARLAGRRRIIWNVRASTLEPRGIRLRTRVLVRIASAFSRFLPHTVIFVSDAARRVHEALSYEPARMVIVPNGFDTDEFRPDAVARGEIRSELGVDDSDHMIGLIARYHPMKDHLTFIRASALYAAEHPHTYFLLCGPGIDWSVPELASAIDAAGLRSRFRLLGSRSDIPRVMNALDVVTLCSWYGEGFPNVVGEAMACGVPCVVTPIGASEEIVGDAGGIVPPRDPAALAAGWAGILGLPEASRQELRARARDRIVQEYGLPDIIHRYEQIYEQAIH